MYIFKVGDKVRVRDTCNVRCFSSAHDSIGEVFTLNKDDARQMNDIYNNMIHLNNNRFGCNYVREDFELVEQGCEPCGTTISSGNVKEFIDKATYSMRSALTPWGMYKVGLDMGFEEEYKLSSNKKTIMSKISSYVKNLTLSADEKLLRKYGLKNECGEVTVEGQEAILENFYNSPENIAYLVSIAQGLEDEVKKNK